MSKKKELIPKLRFPEFVDEGEWEEKKLGKIAKYENGKAHEQNIVKQGNYIAVNSKFISTDGKVKKYTNTANCLASKGEILMVLSDLPNGKALAKCFYVDINNNYSVNQRICKITPINAENKILYYLLNRNPYFLSFDDGVKQTNLRNEDVLKCPIILPKIQKEQQKIASCLSSLDEMIAAQGQKLDLLKDHKKGLMQKLFPQEGEKVPKYRFKEFKNNGEWIERKLGEIAHVSKLAGYEFTKHIVYENKGKIIALRGLNIKNNGLELSDVKYIDNSELNKLNRSKLFIDDLMFTYIGTIGEVALIPENDKYYLAPNVSRIRPNKKEIYAKFLLQYFNVPNFKGKEISKYISSSSQPALTMENVRKFSIFLPNLNEQQKIASCLSSLDALITAQTEKIEQLKLHKKGLMHGLFPKIND